MAINYDDTGGRVAELEKHVVGSIVINRQGYDPHFAFSVDIRNLQGVNFTEDKTAHIKVMDDPQSEYVSARDLAIWFDGAYPPPGTPTDKEFIATADSGQLSFELIGLTGSGWLYLIVSCQGVIATDLFELGSV